MQPGFRASIFATMAVVAACGGSSKKPTTPTTQGTEDSGRTVRNVEIVGNEHIADSSLISGLATRPPSGRIFKTPQPYDPIELERDRQRIEAYYKDEGYYSARVTRVQVKRIGSDQVDAVFTVQEGPQSKIRSVKIRGAPDVPGLRTVDLERIAELKIGEGMVYDDYTDAKSRIRARLVRAGYAFAEVSGRILADRTKAIAHVRIRVDPGPRAVFGKTTIAGRGKVPESSIRARLTWKPGERFDAEELDKSRAALYGLNVFSTVTFEYAKQKRPEVADVTVRLREGLKRELKLGGGVGVDSTRYEIRGRAAYTEKSFLLPLMTLRVEVRPSYSFLRSIGATSAVEGLGGEISAALTKEDFLTPLVRGTAGLTLAARQYNAYSITGPQLVLGVTRPFLNNRLTVGLAWQFRYQTFLSDKVTDPAEEAELGIQSPYQLGYFQQSIGYDARDNPIAPRKGFYAELRMEEAGAYAGSAFEYIRILPEARAYLPVGDRIVLAVRARYGRSLTGPVLPITERFFAGGAASQRGFGLQRLSPRIGRQVDTPPIGGRALAEGSAEARLDLFKLFGNWLGIATFLDGGDVTRKPEDLQLTNLHWAAGVGLRLRTIIGPVRLDVAWRLNRKGPADLDPSEPWAWHLSLGEAF